VIPNQYRVDGRNRQPPARHGNAGRASRHVAHGRTQPGNGRARRRMRRAAPWIQRVTSASKNLQNLDSSVRFRPAAPQSPLKNHAYRQQNQRVPREDPTHAQLGSAVNAANFPPGAPLLGPWNCGTRRGCQRYPWLVALSVASQMSSTLWERQSGSAGMPPGSQNVGRRLVYLAPPKHVLAATKCAVCFAPHWRRCFLWHEKSARSSDAKLDLSRFLRQRGKS